MSGKNQKPRWAPGRRRLHKQRMQALPRELRRYIDIDELTDELLGEPGSDEWAEDVFRAIARLTAELCAWATDQWVQQHPYAGEEDDEIDAIKRKVGLGEFE